MLRQARAAELAHKSGDLGVQTEKQGMLYFPGRWCGSTWASCDTVEVDSVIEPGLRLM